MIISVDSINRLGLVLSRISQINRFDDLTGRQFTIEIIDGLIFRLGPAHKNNICTIDRVMGRNVVCFKRIIFLLGTHDGFGTAGAAKRIVDQFHVLVPKKCRFSGGRTQ